jgi:hypothetical protein
MANTEGQYAEATRCPKCKEPTNVRIKAPAPRAAHLPPGTQVHTGYCENERCKWYNTAACFVQVNPDGSVPPAKNHSREPKLYVGLPDDEDLSNRILQGLARQVEAETQGGGEVRGR